MSVFRRLKAWWSKDDLEVADEETRMTSAEREVAEEDYEARKDDTDVQRGSLLGGQADYERDSEPPK
jgi:hypothetical protein